MTQPPKPSVPPPTENRIKPFRAEQGTRVLLREQIANTVIDHLVGIAKAPSRRLGREQFPPGLWICCCSLPSAMLVSRSPQSIKPHQLSTADLFHAQILK